MPEVTVWRKPKGLPMATTKSPTRNLSELPKGASLSLSSSIAIIATSVSLSVPITLATASRPSLSVTVILSAPSIT